MLQMGTRHCGAMDAPKMLKHVTPAPRNRAVYLKRTAKHVQRKTCPQITASRTSSSNYGAFDFYQRCSMPIFVYVERKTKETRSKRSQCMFDHVCIGLMLHKLIIHSSMSARPWEGSAKLPLREPSNRCNTSPSMLFLLFLGK